MKYFLPRCPHKHDICELEWTSLIISVVTPPPEWPPAGSGPRAGGCAPCWNCSKISTGLRTAVSSPHLTISACFRGQSDWVAAVTSKTTNTGRNIIMRFPRLEGEAGFIKMSQLTWIKPSTQIYYLSIICIFIFYHFTVKLLNSASHYYMISGCRYISPGSVWCVVGYYH